MTFTQMIILTLLVFFCSYTVIDRICKCIEHGRTAKAYNKLSELFGENIKKAKEEEEQ